MSDRRYYHAHPKKRDELRDPGVNSSRHRWWHFPWCADGPFVVFTSPLTHTEGSERRCAMCDSVVSRWSVRSS